LTQHGRRAEFPWGLRRFSKKLEISMRNVYWLTSAATIFQECKTQNSLSLGGR
jgi:hypothetical protein